MVCAARIKVVTRRIKRLRGIKNFLLDSFAPLTWEDYTVAQLFDKTKSLEGTFLLSRFPTSRRVKYSQSIQKI
jgi:hypothetical protein